jgi:hypothetical protein
VDDYVHLRNAFNNDADINANNVQQVILPTSFTGSPGYMYENNQDVITYVRKFGHPELAIFFICILNKNIFIMNTANIGVTWKFIREVGKNINTYLTKRVSEAKRHFTTYILLYKIVHFLTLC